MRRSRILNWLNSTAIVAAAVAAVGCSTTEKKTEESVEQAERGGQALVGSRTLIGYWHNFDNLAAAPIRLNTVSSAWDIVIVAFAEDAGNGHLRFTPLDKDHSGATVYSSPSVFTSDVTAVKNGGARKVLLSLGGGEGLIKIPDNASEDNFVADLTSIIQTYGFDGVDIDLESGSQVFVGQPIVQHIISGINRVKANIGSGFYLTMAPEWPYVQGGYSYYGTGNLNGAYLAIIDGLRSSLNVLHVQLYNNPGFYCPYTTASLAQGTKDMIVASNLMLLRGFTYPQTTNANTFVGLNASQVAFGLPSGTSSAGSGYASPSVITEAFDCLSKGTNCGTIKPGGTDPSGNVYWPAGTTYPTLRGVMTWSINWDVHDGNNFSVPIGNYLHATQTGDTTAPSVPSGLGIQSGQTVTSTNVPLSWTASTDSGSGVAMYKVYRCTGSSCTPSTQIGTSATTTYADNTVAGGTTYRYSVSAQDVAGNNSAASAIFSQTTPTSSDTAAPSTPGTPSTSNITSSSVTVSWGASTDNVGVTGYNVYRGGTKIGTSATTSYTDSSVSPSTTYSYTVAAYDAAGNLSTQSSAVSATTSSGTSQNCSGAPYAQSNCQTYATNTIVSNNGHNWKCTNGNCANCAVSTACAPGASGCPWGTVWADQGVCGSTSDTQAPSVPANLAKGTVAYNSVPLTWSASTDNVGVTGYKIFRSTTEIGTSTSTSFTDGAVQPSTTYSYRVAAYDAAGNLSGMSATLTVSTPAPPPDTQAPSVPTNLAQGTVTSSGVAFSWSASTDNVGIAGYKIYRGGTLLATTTGTGTSYTDSTAAPSTTYAYKVASYDAAGNNSAQSAALNVTTAAASSTCWTAYVSSCSGYVQGTKVSKDGHNWTCTNGNCANCAVDVRCAPGGSGCPWGDSNWTDGGTCK